MQVCPSCKKKQKNLILHNKKSIKCKDNVSEEGMKILEDQSKKRRQAYMRERRRKSKEENHQMAKNKNNENKEQKEGRKEDSQNKLTVPDRCPICYAKKKNILLHIKTKESCYIKIGKQVFEEWSKMARCQTKKIYHHKFYDRKRKTEKEKENRRRTLENIEAEEYYVKFTCSQSNILHNEKQCRLYHFPKDAIGAGDNYYEQKRWWVTFKDGPKYILITEEEAKKIDELGKKLIIEKIKKNDPERIHLSVPIELRSHFNVWVDKREFRREFRRITKEEADEIGYGVTLKRETGPGTSSLNYTTVNEKVAEKIENGCWVEFKNGGKKYIKISLEEALDYGNRGLGMKSYIEKMKKNKVKKAVDC